MKYSEFKNRKGYLVKTWSNKAGVYHHDKLPAYISYHENGRIYEEEYYENGALHRIGDPASITYYENGNIFFSIYSVRGNIHRRDGPAIIDYNYDGSILREEFWLSGICLGQNEKGFWKLWDKLNEKERNNINIIKSLSRLS